VREGIANVQNIPRRKTRRWDVEKLNKDIARRDKYHQVLESKLKSEGDEGADSVQNKWEQLEKAIKAAAEETVGETKHKKNGLMKSVQHISERRIMPGRR
jgi:hypothetical protein